MEPEKGSSKRCDHQQEDDTDKRTYSTGWLLKPGQNNLQHHFLVPPSFCSAIHEISYEHPYQCSLTPLKASIYVYLGQYFKKLDIELLTLKTDVGHPISFQSVLALVITTVQSC